MNKKDETKLEVFIKPGELSRFLHGEKVRVFPATSSQKPSKAFKMNVRLEDVDCNADGGELWIKKRAK
jgi:hypothetical protein